MALRFFAKDTLPKISDDITSAAGENTTPVDLTGSAVYVSFMNISKIAGTDTPDLTTTASVVSPSTGGKIEFQFTSGQTDMLAASSGNRYSGEWIIDFSNDGTDVQTFPFDDEIVFLRRIRNII